MQLEKVNFGESSTGRPDRCLTILIPTYRRPRQLELALSSIFDNHSESDLSKIQVIVGEDGSGPPWEEEYDLLWQKMGSKCMVFRNVHNVGMAENLLSLARHSQTMYSMILTDDDSLIAGALPELLALVERAGARVPGTIVLPRLHVDEDGRPRGRSATVFRSGRVRPSGTNALRLTPRAHILTGLVLRTDTIVNSCWMWALDNAYFPMAIQYYAVRDSGAILSNKRVVAHTVDNETHWHRWGSTRNEQSQRLYRDRSLILETLTNEALERAESRSEKIRILLIRKGLDIYWLTAVYLNDSNFDYEIYRSREAQCGSAVSPLSRGMFVAATSTGWMLQRCARFARRVSS